MNLRLIVAVIGLLLAGMALAGCGLEGQPFSTQAEPDAGPVVSAEDIADEKPGSPRDTVLRWWRGLQTKDPGAVAAAYAPRAREDLPKGFSNAMILYLSPPAGSSSIDIYSVEQDSEDSTTLYATIDSPNAQMNGPLALPMVRVGEKWLLANNKFLDSLLGAYAAGADALGDPTSGGGG